MEIIEAVVTEFSLQTASPMGLPWDFHARCRDSLETSFLQNFFLHASAVAQESAPSVAAGGESGVCLACMSLMCAILAWDFK